eukprot:5785555-Amphidinium_carterae.1
MQFMSSLRSIAKDLQKLANIRENISYQLIEEVTATLVSGASILGWMLSQSLELVHGFVQRAC